MFRTLYLSATGKTSREKTGFAAEGVDQCFPNLTPGWSPSLSWSPSNTCLVPVVSPGAPVSSERG